MKTVTPSAYVVKDDTVMIFVTDGSMDLPAIQEAAAAYAAVDASQVVASSPEGLPAVVKIITLEGEHAAAKQKEPEPDIRGAKAPADDEAHTGPYPGAGAEKAGKAASQFYRDKNPPTPSASKDAKLKDLTNPSSYEGLLARKER